MTQPLTQHELEIELANAETRNDMLVKEREELRVENEMLTKWQDLAFELLSEVRQWVAPGSITDLEAPKALRVLMRDREQRGAELTDLRTRVTELERERDGLRQLIIDGTESVKNYHNTCYYGLGYMFNPDTMKEDCKVCAAKRQMKAIATTARDGEG